MTLPIIDADAHVVEPFSLWRERMPARFHDRVWRREVGADGRETLYHDGRPLSVEWTTGTLSTPGAVQEGGRLDIDIDTEVDEGVRDPHRRLALMDEQGIAASVLFPSMMLGLADVHDVELQVAYARAYNSWIAEFCSVDPVRLLWGGVLPTADLAVAAEVAAECIGRGARTVMVPPILDAAKTSLADRALDPLYALLQEAGVPLVVHAVNPANSCLDIAGHLRGRIQWQMGYSFQAQLATLHVLESGLLDRFPGLRIGFFEGDLGWVPHWFERLQATFAKMALVSRRLAEPVRETFRRQCVISADMNDPLLAETVRYLGADRVLFASDWPHHDGTWPDPIVAVRDHPALTDAQRREILVHAPAAFFGLDVADLARRSGAAVDAPMAGVPPLLPHGRGPAIAGASVRR
ncbi:amidohydrolase family protein [Dactylosporangium sp. NPDC005555]|uniref:amidohydrolase family protein n=1 Tax=Dactylosporangium sp. NPDC005555 TaxID=3154889 RepID=UPI00339DAE81